MFFVSLRFGIDDYEHDTLSLFDDKEVAKAHALKLKAFETSATEERVTAYVEEVDRVEWTKDGFKYDSKKTVEVIW